MNRRNFLASIIATLQPSSAATCKGLDDLWGMTVSPYLDAPLWLATEAYDACHALMPTMHAAFYTDAGRVSEFSRLFARMVAQDDQDVATCEPRDELTRLHGLYLAALFIGLADDVGHQQMVPLGLRDRLRSELDRYWVEKQIDWYSGSGYPGGEAFGHF